VAVFVNIENSFEVKLCPNGHCVRLNAQQTQYGQWNGVILDT